MTAMLLKTRDNTEQGWPFWCDNGHDEIEYYIKGPCPLCALAARLAAVQKDNDRLRQEVNVFRESLGQQPLDDERPWEMAADSASPPDAAPPVDPTV